MRLHLIFLSLLIFLSFLLVRSEAVPTCTLRAGGGSCNAGETCIFSVFKQNDTHVGSCSYYNTSNNFLVCCTEINSATIRSSSCNADEGGIISMQATSNSHAGRNDYYNNIVCAKNSSSGNPIVTNIRSSCLSREKCAVSVFQQNNTHVGSCGYFGTSVCIQELFNVTVTMVLNNTSPNWNDSLMLSGVATRGDGSAIDTSSDPADVAVYLNSTNICITATNSTGGYTCNFTAPLAIGLYQLNITVLDPTTSKTSSNATTFNVKQQFGGTATTEAEPRYISCYEEPRLIQNPDGTIKISIVRICVWK